MIKSHMRIKLILNAKHEGEVFDIDQKEIIDALKETLLTKFQEEDDGLDVTITSYIQEFEYADNRSVLAEMIKARIDKMDYNELQELEELFENE